VNSIVLEHPEDLKNGDYSTNISLTIAKSIERNPKELAEKIVAEINRLNVDKNIEKVEAAPAGFINFYLSRKFFSQSVEEILNEGANVGKNKILDGKKIMIEYTDPNPFKPFHIGHLMTNAIGESVARILEHSGADVSRANYQGDVGLHVAKAIWGLLEYDFNTLENISKEKIISYFKNSYKFKNSQESSFYIGTCYVAGSNKYETDAKVKKEIDELNKKIYERTDEKINAIYDWGFDVTMEAFEDLYKVLGTKFDYYFLESAMADIGRDIVNENKGKIFEESDGAIVFKAEKYDPKLHTRVFITSTNLPTYETKELGLASEKFKTEPDMNLSITVTANEQKDYMKVVYKALSLIHPEYENKMLHITHGMMRFASGKMGSRKGNVVTGESLLRDTIALVMEKLKEREWDEIEKNAVAETVGVSAIKYSILKQNTGGDIIYDFEKSISFEGDSGPYLQYSYARANSVLEKAQKENIFPDFENVPAETFEVEKMLYKFPEVVTRAVSEYEPHYIANYLIEIARSYNSFYGNNVIVNKEDPMSSYKVALTYAFSFVMKNGLHLLGIEAPKKM
jgi:arginyl-tRNA synthetase